MANPQPQNKEYIRPMPADWWLKKKSFMLFMIRELTCVFVGIYAFFLLMLASRLSDAEAFAATLKSPLWITLQIIALPWVMFHTVTWLNLTPKVLVIWRGEDRVPAALIAGAHYFAWLIASVVLLWIVFSCCCSCE